MSRHKAHASQGRWSRTAFQTLNGQVSSRRGTVGDGFETNPIPENDGGAAPTPRPRSKPSPSAQFYVFSIRSAFPGTKRQIGAARCPSLGATEFRSRRVPEPPSPPRFPLSFPGRLALAQQHVENLAEPLFNPIGSVFRGFRSDLGRVHPLDQ